MEGAAGPARRPCPPPPRTAPWAGGQHDRRRLVASFDGPGRAIRCAVELSSDLQALGLEIRAGIHTGEGEVGGGRVGGIALHIAARVMAQAEAGEVLVSSTVKDLVAGSGLEFADRGRHSLKGIEGEWQLFSVRT